MRFSSASEGGKPSGVDACLFMCACAFGAHNYSQRLRSTRSCLLSLSNLCVRARVALYEFVSMRQLSFCSSSASISLECGLIA